MRFKMADEASWSCEKLRRNQPEVLVTSGQKSTKYQDYLHRIRPSNKKTHVSRPDFYKKESGRADFLLFIISYCMLSLHVITFPQGYVGALRSNISKTKHQILIKHKFV